MQIGPVNLSWTRPRRVSDMLPSERVDMMRVTGTGIMNVLRDGNVDIDDLKERLSYYEDLRAKNKAFASLRDNLAWMELRADLQARLESFKADAFWHTLVEPRKAFVDAIEGIILGGLIGITDDAAVQQYDATAEIKGALAHPEKLIDEENHG